MPPLPDRVRAVSVLALLAFAYAGGRSFGGEPASDPARVGDFRAFEATVRPFFAEHCVECHGDKESGEVRLDRFTSIDDLTARLSDIEKVRAALRQRVMPPKRRPKPGDADVRAVISWIDGFLDRADSQTPRGLGPVVRRLNRAEYNNTVRDLFGIDFRPADDFPQDTPGHGFDTVGGALTVSPVLTEKYLSAAEKVARAAVFGVEPMKPERTAHQPWFAADAFSTYKGVKFAYDETGMSLPSAMHVVQRFPADGEYTFRAILRGVRPVGSDPVELAFWIDGKLAHETKVPVPTEVKEGRGPGELNGLWAEFRSPMRAGEHWLSVTILRTFEGLPPVYNGPKPSNSTAGISRRGTDAFFPMYLDVVGPYKQAAGPTEESIRKLYRGRPRDFDNARAVVADLAKRAYRRPVSEREVDQLVGLIEAARADGESFEEGLSLAIQRLLVSPHFLFRVEREPPAGSGDGPYPVSPHELAARLSYFLWSSTPDGELLDLADAGKLRDPAALEAQVRRMLKDPKAHALVENFGGQWLQFRALESHTPDRNKFMEFTDYTRMSMKEETELFFDRIVRDDRSVLDFLDADYTFLNQRLAEFYGISGVKGHEFRKVDLAGTRRGGVLTHASVLTVSSYANRTSPVLRGKWILENLLNSPPPPPPPDVPVLDEQTVGKSASLREQLESHRANPKCVSCHARMDPLGFALEHFDAIGMWRDKDGEFPINTEGTLPDGRSFKGYEQLRETLKADATDFVECLIEKMLTYALGRGPERGDRRVVKAVADRMAADDYRFSSLVLGIVFSEPFQMRTAQRGPR